MNLQNPLRCDERQYSGWAAISGLLLCAAMACILSLDTLTA
ncbi:MAG: hypothetical protein P8K80_05145 [Phycisphaerales bacterium]|nr:hypothetical protein [Phycisphaerales bacterium]